MSGENTENETSHVCVSRRKFLVKSGALFAGSILLPPLAGMGNKAIAAEIVQYPRRHVGNIRDLPPNEPQYFNYPDDAFNAKSLLVRLGTEAGGGIGPDMDVVAFNGLCTHMGGDMSMTFKDKEQVLGPCPFHQTTFDLTRHGIVIAGHATESLPQVLLELDGNEIYATGMIGLIYGRYDNLNI